MKVFLKSRSVNFNFREYINNGFKFLKKDFRSVFLAYLLSCRIMSIILFSTLLAIGNLYKYLYKLRRHQLTSFGDDLDFRDFMPFCILQLIIFASVLYRTFLYLFVISGEMRALLESNEVSNTGILILSAFLLLVAISYFILKSFYIISLICLKGIEEIKEIWYILKVMMKENFCRFFLHW